MDLSEVWRVAVLTLGYVTVFSLSIVGFYFAYRLGRRWKGVMFFAVSSIVLIGNGLALWFDITWVEGTRMRGPAIVSPDRTHVAVLYWVMSGAFGFDHVYVAIRSRNSPFVTEVYRGVAQSPPEDPKIIWKDDHHLLISYWEQGKIAKCEPHSVEVAGIEVLCQE